ncbi:hypothetical protein K439DRAFT_1614352 [Ramaria rubella]|nr:hypothetical protein K439DRAFT_1614352 [Ramaria rubella]
MSLKPGFCLNPDCSTKLCGMFVPIYEDPLVPLLSKHCVCGCIGVQHYKYYTDYLSKSNAPDPTTESTPETSTMPANGTTSFVPPPSGVYECLKAAAKDCKTQINAAQMDGISLSYDLAAKVYQKAFEQLSEKSRGKKRQVDDEEFAPSVSKKSKTSKTKIKESKTSIFQIVLMPSTSKVDAGICLMLDEKMSVKLFFAMGISLTRPGMQFSQDISNEELISKLSVPFQPIAEFAHLLEAGDLAPWQLLSKSIRRKGQTPLLLAFNKLQRNISYQDLTLYASLLFLVSAISAANQQFNSLATPVWAYKPLSKAIFISLPQGEIDIPFEPSLCGGSDLDSESTADIEMAHMKDTTLPTASLSDDKTLPLACMSPLFGQSATKSPGVEDELSSISRMLRIFEHIYYAVEENETLILAKFIDTFISGLLKQQLLMLASFKPWSYSHIPSINATNQSHKFFLLHTVSSWSRYFTPMLKHCFFLMAHLHCTYDRVYYNTWELAQLRLDLQEHGDKLKPATIEHNIQLDLDEHCPSKFHEVLTLRYSYKPQGGANACIDPTKLLTGPFGLHGLLDNYIYPFFDSFPLDHIGYFELHMIFHDFCEQAHNMIQALTRTDMTPAPSTPLKPMSQTPPSKVKDSKAKITRIGPEEQKWPSYLWHPKQG